MTKHDKLVRDKYPDFFTKKGIAHKVHIEKDDKKFWSYLKEKLLEEVTEFLESENDNELGDVLEVMDGILDFIGPLRYEAVMNNKNKKAKELGKFKRRVILEEAQKKQ